MAPTSTELAAHLQSGPGRRNSATRQPVERPLATACGLLAHPSISKTLLLLIIATATLAVLRTNSNPLNKHSLLQQVSRPLISKLDRRLSMEAKNRSEAAMSDTAESDRAGGLVATSSRRPKQKRQNNLPINLLPLKVFKSSRRSQARAAATNSSLSNLGPDLEPANSLASLTTDQADVNNNTISDGSDINNNNNQTTPALDSYQQNGNINSVNGTIDLSLYANSDVDRLYGDALLVYVKNFNETLPARKETISLNGTLVPTYRSSRVARVPRLLAQEIPGDPPHVCALKTAEPDSRFNCTYRNDGNGTVTLTCGAFRASYLWSCDSIIKKVGKNLCKLQIIFRDKPYIVKYLDFTPFMGCNERPIEYEIILEGPGFRHESSESDLLFISNLERPNINLINVTFVDTLITSEQLKPLVLNNFALAKNIYLLENKDINSIEFDTFNLRYLRKLVISNSYLLDIAPNAIIVGPKMNELSLYDLRLSRLGQNAIAVKDPRCRQGEEQKNLRINFVYSDLGPLTLKEPNPIVFLLDNSCKRASKQEYVADVTLDFRNNSFEGHLDEQVFVKMILGARLQSANFRLVLDNLACCQADNAWMFRLDEESWKSIYASCSDLPGTSVNGITNIQQLNGLCTGQPPPPDGVTNGTTSTTAAPENNTTSSTTSSPVSQITGQEDAKKSEDGSFIKYVILIIVIIIIVIIIILYYRLSLLPKREAKRRTKSNTSTVRSSTAGPSKIVASSSNGSNASSAAKINDQKMADFKNLAMKEDNSLTRSEAAFIQPNEPSPSLVSSHPGLPERTKEADLPLVRSTKTEDALPRSPGANLMVAKRSSPASSPTTRRRRRHKAHQRHTKSPLKSRTQPGRSPQSPKSPGSKARPPGSLQSPRSPRSPQRSPKTKSKSPQDKSAQESPRSPNLSASSPTGPQNRPPGSPKSLNFSKEMDRKRKRRMRHSSPANK